MQIKMEVEKAIYGRRSVRKFKGEKIPESLTRKILEATAHSPSACGDRPWGFIMIEDRHLIDALSGKVRKSRGLLGKMLKITGFLRRKDMIFYDAPLLILMTARKGREWNQIDCGIAAQTMMLAAYDSGLGSCCIGHVKRLNRDRKTLKELGVPEGEEIITGIVYGYPAEKKRPSKRSPRIVNWIK